MTDHVPVVRTPRRPSPAAAAQRDAALAAAAAVSRPQDDERSRSERDEPPMARGRRGAGSARPQGGSR